MSDFSEEIQKLVESNGDKVGIHGADCVVWKLNHNNCFGCEYELGCGKLVHLMLVLMLPMVYKPNSYDDFVRMGTRIEELNKLTLDAKTVGELKAVPSR